MKLALVALTVFLSLAACSGGPTDVGTPSDDAGTAMTDDAAAPSNDDAAAEAAVDAGPPINTACVSYPKGPYGTGVGQVLNPKATWQGYAANDALVTTLKMTDVWDCDGSKGIDALIFDTSAGWCAACETQAHDEAQLTAQYDSLHIRATTLLIMDAAEVAATTDTALAWRMTYMLDDVGVYADPDFLLQPDSSSIGLPLTMIVDPRTMKVVKVTEGYGSSYPLKPDATAVSLAQKNHGS